MYKKVIQISRKPFINKLSEKKQIILHCKVYTKVILLYIKYTPKKLGQRSEIDL